ncbi:SRPBCC domain-containing protein [Sphingosinicella sp. LHD-64]|uniref:SRPBCC family protein n=1 Tax=Sphingosinicella sp. LHD-64 TaxID=3072139 RepID=UPI00280C60E1|nr:SRPBCC domain-containing protein [Sphingosinicella sp. LHD-64]MDQ8756219.1 SRPBCC domain-containing protein [Sphingosinicella sp. LHD-64]
MMNSGRIRGQSSLTFERTYQARVEELWDLWTTKAGFESWWGSHGFKVHVETIDPRIGGVLRYDMYTDDPALIASMNQLGREASTFTQAEFVELIPLRRLVIRHMIDFIPGVAPHPHSITVEFVQQGDRAKMRVTIDAHHDRLTTKLSAVGFAQQLEKLNIRFGLIN